jgi:hypothetical protein
MENKDTRNRELVESSFVAVGICLWFVVLFVVNPAKPIGFWQVLLFFGVSALVAALCTAMFSFVLYWLGYCLGSGFSSAQKIPINVTIHTIATQPTPVTVNMPWRNPLS